MLDIIQVLSHTKGISNIGNHIAIKVQPKLICSWGHHLILISDWLFQQVQ